MREQEIHLSSPAEDVKFLLIYRGKIFPTAGLSSGSMIGKVTKNF